MGNAFSKFVSWFIRTHAFFIGAGYLALIVFDFFSSTIVSKGGPSLAQLAVFGLFVFFAAWRLAYATLSEAAIFSGPTRIELSLLIMLIALTVIQATGGIAGPLFPTFYLLTGLTVAFTGFPAGLLLTFVGLGALALNAWRLGTLMSAWHNFATAIGLSLVFTLTIGLYIKVARERVQRAQRTLYCLTSDAEELARRRDIDVSALSKEEVTKADVGALIQIDRLLGDMAEIAKRAMVAHTCLIAFTNEDHNALIVRAISSEEKPPRDAMGADIADTALMKVVTERTSLAVEDIGRFTRQRRHRPWGAPPRAVLAVPLYEHNRIVGVLAVDHRRPYHFAPEEEQFLERMARLAVDAVNREREVRHIAAEKIEIYAFYDIIKKLGSSIDLETVSRVILESGQAIMPYDYSVLARVDTDLGTGLVQAVAGLDPDKWLGATFKINESLVGWVVGAKNYLHYPRLRERLGKMERRRPVIDNELPMKGLESLLCLPLIRRNFVTGLLVFGVKEPEAFTSHEIKLFEVLAVQAATALENANVHAAMEQMATTDGLTGCFNHRFFQEWLDRELMRTKRIPIKISLVIADIDHFKNVNDTYGHPVGDMVLRTVSRLLRKSVRQNDLAARYGGEEFALVLLGTDEKGAVKFANRVRKEIAETVTEYPSGKLQVTVSMGVATFPDDADQKQALIDLADQALYAAKQGGRNRVVHARDLPK